MSTNTIITFQTVPHSFVVVFRHPDGRYSLSLHSAVPLSLLSILSACSPQYRCIHETHTKNCFSHLLRAASPIQMIPSNYLFISISFRMYIQFTGRIFFPDLFDGLLSTYSKGPGTLVIYVVIASNYGTITTNRYCDNRDIANQSLLFQIWPNFAVQLRL